MFAEINRTKQKNEIVGIFYRPTHSNFIEFLCDLDQVLGKIDKENKLVFLMDDWNLNLIFSLLLNNDSCDDKDKNLIFRENNAHNLSVIVMS